MGISATFFTATFCSGIEIEEPILEPTPGGPEQPPNNGKEPPLPPEAMEPVSGPNTYFTKIISNFKNYLYDAMTKGICADGKVEDTKSYKITKNYAGNFVEAITQAVNQQQNTANAQTDTKNSIVLQPTVSSYVQLDQIISFYRSIKQALVSKNINSMVNLEQELQKLEESSNSQVSELPICDVKPSHYNITLAELISKALPIAMGELELSLLNKNKLLFNHHLAIVNEILFHADVLAYKASKNEIALQLRKAKSVNKIFTPMATPGTRHFSTFMQAASKAHDGLVPPTAYSTRSLISSFASMSVAKGEYGSNFKSLSPLTTRANFFQTTAAAANVKALPLSHNLSASQQVAVRAVNNVAQLVKRFAK